MSDFEKDQVMQNRDLRILATNLALVNYQEFLTEQNAEENKDEP
jgi:hypothetical protein